MRSNRFEIFSTSVGQLVKAVTALKSRKMAKYGLKGTGALCLCQILESESGLTATELCRRGEIDKAQVSRCMNELSEKGLVHLEEQDGRGEVGKPPATAQSACTLEDAGGRPGPRPLR